MTGVYIIKRDGVVVYVGATTQYPKRLRAHQWMNYDSVEFIACSARSLRSLERRKIVELRPLDNRIHNDQLKRRLTDNWVLANWHEIKSERRKKYIDDNLVMRAKLECGYSNRTGIPDIHSTIMRRYEKLKANAQTL